MKDVAREAGVSLGTVSKVFNGIHVKDDYRRRVLSAAEKLNYQVNNYARGFKTNKTNSIALLIPTLKHPFFASLTDEIAASLTRHDLRLILILTNYEPEAEQKALTMIRQNKIDGVIGLTYNPNLVVDASIPFVTIDRHFSTGVPCVASDNFGGGQLAAQKLISLGCRNLLFLRTGSDLNTEVNKREAGFVSICSLENIPYDSVTINQESPEPFYYYLQKHMENGHLVYDGIFCNTDLLASQIVSFCHKEHIRVPEDVQIIGYDGIKHFYSEAYYCSTIVQPIAQMAEAAVDLIVSKKPQPMLVILPVHYEAGNTTKG